MEVPCESCSKPVKASAKFCSKCGAKRTPSEPKKEPTVQAQAQADLVKGEHARFKNTDAEKLVAPHCTNCNAVLNPAWAKFCCMCGTGQAQDVVEKRHEAYRSQAREAAKHGKADGAAAKEFLHNMTLHASKEDIGTLKKSKEAEIRRRETRLGDSPRPAAAEPGGSGGGPFANETRDERISRWAAPAGNVNSNGWLVGSTPVFNNKVGAGSKSYGTLRGTLKPWQSALVLIADEPTDIKPPEGDGTSPEEVERADLKELLADKTVRLEKLQHRQEHSPWMMSERQVKLLKRLERDSLLLQIKILRLDQKIVVNLGVEKQMRETLKEKTSVYEELKVKKPWLMSKDDQQQLHVLEGEVKTLTKELAAKESENERRNDKLSELEDRYQGKEQKSEEAKKAALLVKRLKKEIKAKTAKWKEMNEMWVITPIKVNVMEMKELQEQITTLKRQLQAIPAKYRNPPTRGDKATLNCSQCAYELSATDSFCLNCGAKQKLAAKEKNLCQNKKCGKQLKKGARFCNHCGTKQDIEVDVTKGAGGEGGGGRVERGAEEGEDKSEGHSSSHTREISSSSMGDEEEEDDDVEDNTYVPIIIDNGSYSFKAGFSVADNPSLDIPSILVSKNRRKAREPDAAAWDIDWDSLLFGSQLMDSGHDPLDMFEINTAVFSSAPSSWDDLETMWTYLFERLQVDLSALENPILVTEPTFAPLKLKRDMTEALFEKFNFPAVHIAKAPVLTAYSYGDSTGLVVDIGEESAQIVPVVDGFILDHAVVRVKHFGGSIATTLLANKLRPQLQGRTEFETEAIAREVKHSLARVLPNRKEYMKLVCSEEFEVSCPISSKRNDLTLTLGSEILDIGELFFQPKAVLDDQDESVASIQELIARVVSDCSVDVRKELMSNILLCGGVTTMPGFKERVEKELKELLPHAKAYLTIRADPYRHYSAWTGGSVLANIESFQNRWYARWEYDEHGPDGKAPDDLDE